MGCVSAVGRQRLNEAKTDGRGRLTRPPKERESQSAKAVVPPSDSSTASPIPSTTASSPASSSVFAVSNRGFSSTADSVIPSSSPKTSLLMSAEPPLPPKVPSETGDSEDSDIAVPEESAPAQRPSSRLRSLPSQLRTKLHGHFGRRAQHPVPVPSSRSDDDPGANDGLLLRELSAVEVNSDKSSGGAQQLFLDSSSCVPYFGSDCAGPAVLKSMKPGSASSGKLKAKCDICLECVDKVWKFCKNPACTGQFCSDCIGSYASTKVEDALHYVPAVRCPQCWCRISTATWEAFVDTSIRERHAANAAALLSLRCARCDNTESLLIDHESAGEVTDGIVLASLSSQKTDNIRRAWLGFSLGAIDGLKLLSVIEENFFDQEPVGEGVLPAHLQAPLEGLFGLITDIERRVTFQLAVLRKYPKVRTRCCGQKTCFKCKVRGWHPRISCEDRQRRFSSVDALGIQPCPTCGVPTQKTEGCSEVRCVCGSSWTWSSKANSLPGGAPAITIAPGIQNSGIDLLRTLLRHRADLATVTEDGWGIFHHAAAPLQRLRPRSGHGPRPIPPQSDDSRLKALMSVGQTARELMDTPDDNGDTGLSVAIAHDNVAGVKFLLSSGVKVHPEVLTSVRNLSSPRTAAETCEMLRPYAGELPQSPGSLWFWAEAGLLDRAREALEAGADLEIGVGAAVVAVRAAHSAGANVVASRDSLDAIEDLLSNHAKKAGISWVDLRSSGANALLKREIRLVFDNRQLDVAMVKALLEQRANPEERVDNLIDHLAVPAITLVAWADPKIQQGAELEGLRLLLDASGSPNILDNAEDTPLWWALSRPNLETVKLLVARGATWPQQSSCRHLLNMLRSFSSRAMLRSLVDAIAPLFQRLYDGEAGGALPLWMAILGPDGRSAALEGAKALDVDFRNRAAFDGMYNAICVAWLVGHPIADFLAEQVTGQIGAESWEFLSKQVATKLFLGELEGAHVDERGPDFELVEYLLERNAEVNVGNVEGVVMEGGDTPLMLLCGLVDMSESTASSAVRLLLDHHADLEKADADGDTALSLAIMRQNVSMVQALAEAGSSLGASPVDEERSALSWVVHPALLRPIAASIGGTIRATLKDFPSPPLWLVVQFGTLDTLQAILSQEEPPAVGVDEAHALIRRIVQGGGFVDGELRSDSPEDSAVVAELRKAAIAAAPDEDVGAQFWRDIVSQAATEMLMYEIEGAWDGNFELDMSFVEGLLTIGADPNLQVRFLQEIDEFADDDDEEDIMDNHLVDLEAPLTDDVIEGVDYQEVDVMLDEQISNLRLLNHVELSL